MANEARRAANDDDPAPGDAALRFCLSAGADLEAAEEEAAGLATAEIEARLDARLAAACASLGLRPGPRRGARARAALYRQLSAAALGSRPAGLRPEAFLLALALDLCPLEAELERRGAASAARSPLGAAAPR